MDLALNNQQRLICHKPVWVYGISTFVGYLKPNPFLYKYLTNQVEGDSLSIATTLKCRRGCYSFRWIAPLTLDPYLIMLSVKQGGIKYGSLV